ncbi:type II secretion system protein [Priestia filamentosa]|uniref:PilW family protein n=1 Tax=Priestia filamentosa TaxID=1402861 RepID=UPI00397895DB
MKKNLLRYGLKIRKYIKNTFLEFNNSKGFTLLELTLSLMISSLLIGGVLLIFQNNFDVMYQSLNESEKRSSVMTIDNLIKDEIQYGANIQVSNNNDTLKINNTEFSFLEDTKQIIVKQDGVESKVFYEIKRHLSNPVFQINDNTLEVTYVISNRSGTKKVNKKYFLYKERYDEEYLNQT